MTLDQNHYKQFKRISFEERISAILNIKMSEQASIRDSHMDGIEDHMTISHARLMLTSKHCRKEW